MSSGHCAVCGKALEAPLGEATTCPACLQAAGQAPQAAPLEDASSAFSFPITIALVALNALVFALMVLRGVSPFLPTPQQAVAFGADFGPFTLGGQWWRLLTSMFVHFGIVHIGLNMWCLWSLGRAAETLLGRFSYLLGYFASGIFSSISSVYWHPRAASAGASGAIFGLAGVLVSFVYLKKTPARLRINKSMMGSLGSFIFYNLAFGAAIPGISNAAHIGGLVMGLLVGAFLPSTEAPESSRRTRLSLVALFSAACLVASAAAAKHVRSGAAALTSMRQLITQGKNHEPIARLEELTAREPQFAPAEDLLASLYLLGGDYSGAIAALERANNADPSNPTYQRQGGTAYFGNRQFRQAAAFFTEAGSRQSKGSAQFSWSGPRLYGAGAIGFGRLGVSAGRRPRPALLLTAIRSGPGSVAGRPLGRRESYPPAPWGRIPERPSGASRTGPGLPSGSSHRTAPAKADV